VAARRRRVTGQSAPGRDVELELDEVDARDHLGDGVLDLQPGVDLHERELALARLIEELDGRSSPVARELGQPGGRGRQLVLLFGSQARARGFFDDLLVTALVAAGAHAERPDRAVAVGDELDLYVARGADQALHQHALVAKRLRRLRAGALERAWELVGALDVAHAAAATACGGLDHQREAERLTATNRVGEASKSIPTTLAPVGG
jgi:hypothetical protein